MKRGGIGGSKTQKAGARFEESTAQDFLQDFLETGYLQTLEHRPKSNPGTLHGISLRNEQGKPLEIYYQDGIYKLLFEPKGIDWKEHFSARLKPDTAIYSPDKKVLTIVEKKQQEAEGSVAEKLQTCDYKLTYYKTLAEPLGIRVELIWLLGPYFEKRQETLKSVFKYMKEKGSKYYFSRIPINEISI
jgi:hypothetical protein